MNVVVYCSSRDNLECLYEQTADIVGEWIGDNKHTLVYGGVNAGMMHTIANAAKKKGAKVIGVIPERFKHRADELNDEVILMSDLSDRKAKMIELGDVFFVLPGGLGTIDEWLSTLSQFVVECNNLKNIIVVNINGMYDALIEQINRTANSDFARSNHINRSIIVNDIDELYMLLNNLKS